MADLFGWQSEYLAMLEDCEVRVADLDDWERQFVQSLRGQFDRPSFTPSPRQWRSWRLSGKR